jgi:catechol 2,3-dioxygenase
MDDGSGMDFIGFKVLDSMGNRISQLLTLSMKAHHVSFIHHPKKGKLHHGPFVLDTWDNALLAANRISMTIGRTRHGLPHGKTISRTTDQLDKAIFYHDRQRNERFFTALT